MVKQVIVVRKDLNMRKGKLAAQVAHASMKVILDRMHKRPESVDFMQVWNSFFTPAMLEWMSYGPFTKIVVGVETEEELFAIMDKALQANVPYALITDAGKTEFNGVPTNTCIAIGPDEEEKINAITGELKLL